MSFNKVLILGNAGKDPEIRHLEGGAAVANFTVATTEVFRDRSGNRQERTEWHNIVCWRQLAEFAERFVKKGTQVFIEGKIRTREYNDQNGQRRFVTEIVADTLQLTGRKPEGQGGVQPQGGYQSQGSYQQPQRPVQPAPATPAPQDFPAMDDFNASSDANDLPF
ncbi:MAG: single-stranded DNA-binding protein [Bacteroidales bacterium]|jgi:single-strand DNA-binding protein|nr:single-stranded DNA-binding protein [Bacteroidales bacterium]